MSASSTPTSTASSRKGKNNVVLALGIVGGILFAGLLMLLFFLLGKTRGRKSTTNIEQQNWVPESYPNPSTQISNPIHKSVESERLL
jgi:flagellar basal body-associated protein FliL